MTRLLIGFCLMLCLAIPAFAAPGDPRFLQGTLEWPAALTGEPVMIVRGDDGRVYSADVAGARRQGSEPLRVGGRVALLVIEGARPHDVTAIVIGTGDAATLARALSQGGTGPSASAAAATAPPAPVAMTPPSAAAPVSTPAPVSGQATALAATPPAPQVAIPAPVAVVVPPAAAPAPTAPPASAPTPTPVAAAPPPAPAPPAATPPASAPAPPPAVAPAAVVTPPAAPPVAAPPAVTPSVPAVAPAPTPSPGGPTKVFAPAGERKQWARVDGKVQSVEGALLVLKADNGSVVVVDISQLNPSVSQSLRRGRVVSVYGYPLEQKFEAAGYIELDPAHPEPPRTRWSR
jgi:hypothetical protein